MPELNNRKQELFCRFLAEPGCTQKEAYVKAGFTPSNSNASGLANKPHIKERIRELIEEKAEAEARHAIALKGAELVGPEEVLKVEAWTAHAVRDLLARNAQLAQEAGQFGAAKESIKLLGDSLGMFEEGAAKSGKPSAADKLPAPINLTLINSALAPADEDAGNSLAPAR